MANSAFSSSPSSHFGLFSFVANLVVVLLLASSFGSALECYYAPTDPGDEPLGGRPAAAAWQLNKLMNFASINGAAFGVPANGGNQTVQCLVGYNHCVTVHCQKVFSGRTMKSCAYFPAGTTTAEEACSYLRDKLCGDDPKFYCRFCQTDKCNNDDVVIM